MQRISKFHIIIISNMKTDYIKYKNSFRLDISERSFSDFQKRWFRNRLGISR